MTVRVGFIVVRLVVVVAIAAAIVAQLVASVSFVGPSGPPDASAVVVNFLSYFTIDSNTLSAVVLLVGAVTLIRRPTAEPRVLTVARVAVTTYMIITGVVDNVLLRGTLAQGATVGWSNEILHVVAPVYLVIHWFAAPGRSRLRSRDALLTLVFPAIWVVYTLVRGPLATNPYLDVDYWYPYPFINPVTSAGGCLSVAGYVAVIGIVTIALAAGLTRTTGSKVAP